MNSTLFKALGEETKHLILKELAKEDTCACEIPEKIGRSQNNTSMHLSKLKEWDLVENKREGRKIIYSLAEPKVKEIIEIMEG